jgi:hypothetical protein
MFVVIYLFYMNNEYCSYAHVVAFCFLVTLDMYRMSQAVERELDEMYSVFNEQTMTPLPANHQKDLTVNN